MESSGFNLLLRMSRLITRYTPVFELGTSIVWSLVISRRSNWGATDPPLIMARAHPYTDIGNNTFMTFVWSYISCRCSRFGWGSPRAVAGVLAGGLPRHGRSSCRRLQASVGEERFGAVDREADVSDQIEDNV